MCVPRTIYEFDNFPAVRNSENVEKRLPVDCHAAVRTCSIGAFYHLCGNGTGSSCPTNVSLLYFSIPDTSTAIYVITSHKKELSWRVFVAMEAADITVCTVLISLSTGTNRIFFFFYFFAVLVGAMRGGSSFGFGLTIISALLFTVFGYIARPEETLEPYRFLLGPLWLLALGCIISYWAGGEIRLKSKLALLKELSLTANPRYDVDRIIAGFMERLLVFYNTDTCVLVLADPNAQTYRLHRATRQNRNAG